MKTPKDYLIEADMKTTGKTREHAEKNYNDTYASDKDIIDGIIEMMEAYANDKVEEYKKQVTEG